MGILKNIFSRSEKKIQKIINNSQVGDLITFGRFPQNKGGKDLTPIDWMIISKTEKECLLISKYCLDTVGYCELPYKYGNTEVLEWEQSYLKNWLNNYFYDIAFNEKEKQLISETTIITEQSASGKNHCDSVFLLSKEEVETFFPTSESRQALPTQYAIERGARMDMHPKGKACWWILPYMEHTGEYYPQAVFQTGEIQYHSRNIWHEDFTVRPAIRIKL